MNLELPSGAQKALSVRVQGRSLSRSGRSALNLALLICGTAFASIASSAPDRDDDGPDSSSKIYAGQLPRVQLQPFSLDPPAKSRRAIRVAYYSPQPVRTAQPNYSDDGEEVEKPTEFTAAHPLVPGNRAVLRGGVAYAPSNAPQQIKNAIWAVNGIRHKPYHWGGGHGDFYDSGYDCSGAVSFALHSAGALGQPLPSSDFLRYGERGCGRWITIYSRRGHTYAVIAGLRLDTTDFRYGGDVGPRWYTDARSTWGFSARHPAGL